MSGIRHFAADIVTSTLILGMATLSLCADPVPATAPTGDGASVVDSSLGSLRFRLEASRLRMRWDKSAGVTSEPKPILRPTGKLVLQSAGIARIGVGETIFASVVRQGTAAQAVAFLGEDDDRAPLRRLVCQ